MADFLMFYLPAYLIVGAIIILLGRKVFKVKPGKDPMEEGMEFIGMAALWPVIVFMVLGFGGLYCIGRMLGVKDG